MPKPKTTPCGLSAEQTAALAKDLNVSPDEITAFENAEQRAKAEHHTSPPVAATAPAAGDLEQVKALTNLRAELHGMTSRAEVAEGKLTAALAEIESLRSKERKSALAQERDFALADVVVAKATIERQKKLMSCLESLCGVKGIDPKDAIPPAKEKPEPTSRETLEARLNEISDPAERREFMQEHRAAVTRAYNRSKAR